MDDTKKEQSTETTTAKIELLEDLITENSKIIDLMIENIKKLDSYAGGSRESADKVIKFVEAQKSEFLKIIEKENINDIKQLTNLVMLLLNSVLEQTRKIAKEAENLYFAKQGELLFAKQGLDKLKNLKKNYRDSLNENKPKQEDDANKEKEQTQSSQDAPTSRIRPDKNPNTRVGKAALDLAERRKKYKNKNT